MAAQCWSEAERRLRIGQLAQARSGFERLLKEPEWVVPARLRLAGIALRESRLREACAHALAAAKVPETEPAVLEALCDLLILVGEVETALDIAHAPALRQADDPEIQAGIGRRFCEQAMPEVALPFLLRAHAQGLDDARIRYFMGLARSYCGDIDAAERDFEACLAREPLHAACHRRLSVLRRATSDRNHVQALRSALARVGESHPDAPPLLYALFKELDDLDDRSPAWDALEKGMRRRRAQVRYDAGAEQALFEQLHRIERPPEANEGATTSGPVPIFIIGQPRSGTTLLERILAGSVDIAEGGELRDFGFQMRHGCDLIGPPQPDAELIRRAQGIDHGELGRRYLERTQWRARGRRFYTDKLPGNFLLVGSIARALPQARFLHMTRAPMDVCFSNLKELFAQAYPHSYDMQDMAAHYRRYRDLMQHWHRLLPGRILDVSYADLVLVPEDSARRVLGFCGVDWVDGIMQIDGRKGAIATASSLQLREPIHARNLDGWQRYAAHLLPLRDALGSFL